MEYGRNRRFRIALVAACAVILIAATVLITSWTTTRHLSSSFVEGPFYRNPKQLSRDGIELVSMGRSQEQRLHEIIWDYYQTEYPKTMREVLEDKMTDTSSVKTQERHADSLEIFEEARLAPPVFSAPRKHKGIDGIIGVMASAYMYTEEDRLSSMGEYMFFFRRLEGGGYSFENMYLLGEDPEIFETSPWNRLIREIGN